MLEPARSVRAVKFGKEFDCIDTDRDGVTSLEDWEDFTYYMCSQFDVDADSPKGSRLLDAVRHRWCTVVGSDCGNNDRKLVRAEYVSVFCDALPSRWVELVLDYAEVVFTLCDGDDDGCLTRQEFATLLRIYGVREVELSETMNQMGLRTGQVVSKAMYTNLVMDFFFSADAQAPGSWLMGKV